MSTNQNKGESKKKDFKALEYSTSKSHIYACFEQPQTIQILKYITMPTPNKLLFDSGTKNVGRISLDEQKNSAILKRVKEFRFQRIYNREEKIKYAFSQEINFIIGQLFRGYSQTVFIYGTEESKKDKILIGESQNAGFLLTTLSEIFEYCHEKQIEDSVTIKISCSIFKDGKFSDPFNFSQNHSSNNQPENQRDDTNTNDTKDKNEQFQSIMCQDAIEGKYLLGCPEIIIRNMRTALKIINLITKKIQQRRDTKEENTQNIVFTIKLEIDTAFDRHTTGEVYEYSIPKLYIVKLGNPSINNTLNGVNKSNQWFINLFNFLQSEVILERNATGKKSDNNLAGTNDPQQNSTFNKATEPIKDLVAQILLPKDESSQTSQNGIMSQTNEQGRDQFTEYIKEVVMRGVADIHCFTSINNKMTSNECLTAFIFNNYLSSYQTKPTKTILNINTYKSEKQGLQDQLVGLFAMKEAQSQKEKQIWEKYRSKYNLQGGNRKSITKGVCGNGTMNGSFLGGKSSSNLNQTLKTSKEKPSERQNASSVTHASKRMSSSDSACSTRQALLSISLASLSQPLQSCREWQTKMLLLSYIEGIKQYMTCCNLCEYEYAQILSQGCEKLNKYIFNEEIEQFYYAKKISLEYSLDLKVTLQQTKQQKQKLQELEERIIKKLTLASKRLTSELQILKSINGRQQHEQLFKTKKARLLTSVKEKDLMSKLFLYYNTMSYHYIYDDNEKLLSELQKTKRDIERQVEKKLSKENSVNYDQIMKNIKKGFMKRINEKRSANTAEGSMDNTMGNELTVGKQFIVEQEEEDNRESRQDNQVSSRPNQQISTRLQKQNSKWLSGSIVSEANRPLNSVGQNNLNQPQNATKKSQSILQKAAKYKMRKRQDELDNMFTNSNVGVVRSQNIRKNFN